MFLDKKLQYRLKYYIFDWDHNILNMPTKIHLDKITDGKRIPIDIDAYDYNIVRKYINTKKKYDNSLWKLRNDNQEETFIDFSDIGENGEDVFINDSIYAIKNEDFGPVWDVFINCLVGGHVFMIITARGHEPQNIEKVIRYIIYEYLTDKQRSIMKRNLSDFNSLFDNNKDKCSDFDYCIDKYLSKCDMLGVKSDYFKNKFNIRSTTIYPEKYKIKAVEYFIKKVYDFGKIVDKSVKVGFSDDDITTSQKVFNFMKDNISTNYPMKYSVYNTKDGVTKHS